MTERRNRVDGRLGPRPPTVARSTAPDSAADIKTLPGECHEQVFQTGAVDGEAEDGEQFGYALSHRRWWGIFHGNARLLRVPRGAIGQNLARLLKSFGCTLLYNKRTPLDPIEEAILGARYATLSELLAQSDVISLK